MSIIFSLFLILTNTFSNSYHNLELTIYHQLDRLTDAPEDSQECYEKGIIPDRSQVRRSLLIIDLHVLG